jgi:hypothetical protein
MFVPLYLQSLPPAIIREYRGYQIQILLSRFNKYLNISFHEKIKNTTDKWMDRQTDRYGDSVRYSSSYAYKERMPRIHPTILG